MTTGTKHMNERPTPETDALVSEYPGVLWPYFARRLEQERDEARNAMAQAQGELDLKTLDFERMREQRDKLAKQRDAERALADRLAGVLQPLLIATWREKQPSKAELAFTAWKEARSE